MENMSYAEALKIVLNKQYGNIDDLINKAIEVKIDLNIKRIKIKEKLREESQ